MHLIFWVTVILQGVSVKGIDLNSIRGRNVCFKYEQKNCNTSFTKEYPKYSRSVTNDTVAETFMLLYTDHDLNHPEILNKCGGRLPQDSKFNPKNPVIVILMPFIVGFCDVAFYREWVLQLQQCRAYNIIVIDYNWGQQLDYHTASLNAAKIVRYQVAILLRNIEEQVGGPLKVTLVGHSLGAQLAGQIGAIYDIDHILGIDPAGPEYNYENKTDNFNRLDPSDAKLVEVWHCNSGPCLPFFGIDYNAGHINFNFNGGSVQLPCYRYSFQTLLRGDLIYGLGTLLLPTICWHAMCGTYFKTSICPTDCQYVGVKCESKTDFKLGKCRSCGDEGENCLIAGIDSYKYIKEVPDTPQTYYVKTSNHCPWCDSDYVNLEGYKDTYSSSLIGNNKN